MPKINIDEQTQLAEPIEIRLNGKDYVVKKVTTDMLKEMTEFSKGNENFNILTKQFAFLTGTDEAELAGIDIRVLSKALESIMSLITEGIAKPKNSPGPATL